MTITRAMRALDTHERLRSRMDQVMANASRMQQLSVGTGRYRAVAASTVADLQRHADRAAGIGDMSPYLRSHAASAKVAGIAAYSDASRMRTARDATSFLKPVNRVLRGVAAMRLDAAGAFPSGAAGTVRGAAAQIAAPVRLTSDGERILRRDWVNAQADGARKVAGMLGPYTPVRGVAASRPSRGMVGSVPLRDVFGMAATRASVVGVSPLDRFVPAMVRDASALASRGYLGGVDVATVARLAGTASASSLPAGVTLRELRDIQAALTPLTRYLDSVSRGALATHRAWADATGAAARASGAMAGGRLLAELDRRQRAMMPGVPSAAVSWPFGPTAGDAQALGGLELVDPTSAVGGPASAPGRMQELADAIAQAIIVARSLGAAGVARVARALDTVQAAEQAALLWTWEQPLWAVRAQIVLADVLTSEQRRNLEAARLGVVVAAVPFFASALRADLSGTIVAVVGLWAALHNLYRLVGALCHQHGRPDLAP
jgi:hypothetical protein